MRGGKGHFRHLQGAGRYVVRPVRDFGMWEWWQGAARGVPACLGWLLGSWLCLNSSIFSFMHDNGIFLKVPNNYEAELQQVSLLQGIKRQKKAWRANQSRSMRRSAIQIHNYELYKRLNVLHPWLLGCLTCNNVLDTKNPNTFSLFTKTIVSLSAVLPN